MVLLHVALTFGVCFVLYIRIFQEAWKQLHAVYSPRAAQIQKEAKTAKMMVLILGVHMLSLIPYLVVVTMRYFVEEEGALSDAKKVNE